MTFAKALIAELKAAANSQDAAILASFFKTGPGEYGEGDVFLGVRVPQTRRICARFNDLPLDEIQKLFARREHECRLAAVILLAKRYARAAEPERQAIFDLYLQNLNSDRINNWDLIDVSCEHVVGAHLRERSRKLLFTLAAGKSVWQRRASLLATFHFIKRGEAGPTLELVEKLLRDPHDLIRKAAGWMLREVGKRVSEAKLLSFLDDHAAAMPRVMLRYAIERLRPARRTHYLKLERT